MTLSFWARKSYTPISPQEQLGLGRQSRICAPPPSPRLKHPRLEAYPRGSLAEGSGAPTPVAYKRRGGGRPFQSLYSCILEALAIFLTPYWFNPTRGFPTHLRLDSNKLVVCLNKVDSRIILPNHVFWPPLSLTEEGSSISVQPVSKE